MRVKSKWNVKDKTHTVAEVGGALAAIAWKMAQNALLNMENHQFQTETQVQRIEIIAEFLCFTIHVLDRMTIDRFTDEDRQTFITELALKSAKNIKDNKREYLGPGEYQQEFIDMLNARMDEYAEFPFSEEEGPSFPMKRYFGDFVTKLFGERYQRWVTDQIIDIEVPDMYRTLKTAVKNLFM